MSTLAIKGEEKGLSGGCLGINPWRQPDREKGKWRLVADKHRIERELMNLVIGPDKAAIDARAYMKELFKVGYDLAVNGYSWAKTPPGYAAWEIEPPLPPSPRLRTAY